MKSTKKMISFHSEDQGELDKRKKYIKRGDPKSHPIWRNESVCFKCTKQGHQKSDCRNPAADPKAFYALEVEDQPLEHDEQLFHLLTEFVPGNDSGADSQ